MRPITISQTDAPINNSFCEMSNVYKINIDTFQIFSYFAFRINLDECGLLLNKKK